jgi:hypothetical protein
MKHLRKMMGQRLRWMNNQGRCRDWLIDHVICAKGEAHLANIILKKFLKCEWILTYYWISTLKF